MNKQRVLSILMILCLMAPMTAEAGTAAKLNQEMATRSGPGTRYTEDLGTWPKSTSITVISQIETFGTVWYQVEFARNGKLVRCYTGKKRVDIIRGTVPQENAVATDDVLTADVTPLFGPGTQYETRKKGLKAGAGVMVFGVEGDWALCEYKEGERWARGYIHTNYLKDTVPEVIVEVTPAPKKKRLSNIIDEEEKWCVDYYEKAYNYGSRDKYFAALVGALPVLDYFDGVPCAQHGYCYSGPGYNYWLRPIGRDYASTGYLDTNLQIFCKENGFIMFRYPSGTSDGYRYGWCVPSTISKSNQDRVANAEFAYEEGMVTAKTYATDDPGYTNEKIVTVSKGTKVTMLAFLNEERNFVYCEFSFTRQGDHHTARGFIPAEALRLR